MKLTGLHEKSLTDGQRSRLEYLRSRLHNETPTVGLLAYQARLLEFAVAVGYYVFETETLAQEALDLYAPALAKLEEETNVPEPS